MSTEILLTTGATCEFNVHGMHCAACELLIEKKLGKSKHVKNVNADLNHAKVRFEVESPVTESALLTEINELIAKDGYSISAERETHTVNYRELGIGFVAALIVVGLFALLQNLGIANVLGGNSLSLPAVFMIGIVASLSSCMAVVGGLVLSISSSYAQNPKAAVGPLVTFHISRIVSFFILGGLIGLIGSAFSLTPEFYLVMGIVLFGVMFVLGMNLLDVFPVFRKFQLRLPKFLGQKTAATETVTSKFAPLLLGAATFFLPCGFTQSMQVNAIATGSFIQGALIMFVFTLGTFPVLGLISFGSVKFAESLKNSTLFFKAAGFIVLFFAIFNLYSTLVAAGLINPLF